jgi:hypothetical protein
VLSILLLLAAVEVVDLIQVIMLLAVVVLVDLELMFQDIH